jgi:hypothetical protein
MKARVSQEQIEAWKQQHKVDVIHEITVPLDDEAKEKAVGYFKKPNLQTIAASEKFAMSDPIKSGLVLFDNCYIGGDDFGDEAKMSAIQELSDLFKIRAAEVKNL